LISAPSGFGKSSLVSAWLENIEIKNAWLSLDGGDSDLIQFLQYFIEAIRKEDESFGSRLFPLLDAPELPPLEVLTTSLLNDLAGLKEEMVFVLDDYHFIHDTNVHQLIVNLMQFPVPHFHLVMTSRQDPPFPLMEWRKKNRLIEIRMNDLIFTQEEIITFFEKSRHFSLQQNNSQSLLNLTEGWASGLRLLSFIINSQEDIEKFISKHHSLDMIGLEEIVNFNQCPNIIFTLATIN
jgi:LuxR family maltose regulon positive regulatory protein